MKLADLIAAVEPLAITGAAAPETPVTSLHYGSRDVVSGGVFFAIQGFTADGHAYIDDAGRRGAAAIVERKLRRRAGHSLNFRIVSTTGLVIAAYCS